MAEEDNGISLAWGYEFRGSLPETPITPGFGGAVGGGIVVTGFSDDNGAGIYFSGSPDYVEGKRVSAGWAIGGRAVEKIEFQIGNHKDFFGKSMEYGFHDTQLRASDGACHQRRERGRCGQVLPALWDGDGWRELSLCAF